MKAALVAGGLAMAGIGGVGLPVMALASLTGMDAASAESACLSNLPSGQVTISDATLTIEQQQNAGTIASVGAALVGQQGEVIAIAAALVESNLVNLDHGDRDSVGLFQERPSQGWGTKSQLEDPVYASTAFYERLLKVPGWQHMAPGDAAQAVERSAFPGRYAGKIAEAKQLVGAASSSAPLAAGLCQTNVPTGLPAGVGSSNAEIQAVIQFAAAQIGKPYQWGATGPNAFDCSGLVQAAYASVGVNLPRTTYQQIQQGVHVDRAHLQAGDLVFPDPGHVQIYAGSGYVIEAPHTGAVIRITPLWGFWQARRIING